LDKLLIIFTKMKSNATRNDVRKKINSLRSNYRKELKKILSSKHSGTGINDVETIIIGISCNQIFK